MNTKERTRMSNLTGNVGPAETRASNSFEAVLCPVFSNTLRIENPAVHGKIYARSQ